MKKFIVFLLIFTMYTSIASAGAIKGIMGIAVSGPRNTLGQGLVGAFKLNDAETTNCTACWLDTSGSANHLSGSLDPPTSGGVDRNSVVDAAIAIADSPGEEDNTLLLTTATISPRISTAFTLSAWINSSDGSLLDGATQYITSLSPVGGPAIAIQLFWASTMIKFQVTTSAGLKSVVSTTILSLNTWYHVMGIWDGSNLNVYLDNVVDATPVAQTGTITSSSNVTEISIGGINASAPNSQAFTGLLDDVAIWSRALTTVERGQVFALGSDFSGIDLP